MKKNLQFDPWTFNVLVGGSSSMDLPYLNIENTEQAINFVKSYGYEVDRPDDLKKLWSYHSRAVTYIKSELLFEDEVFPEQLSDPKKLDKLTNLLIYASQPSHKEDSLQKMACATLKVIHVLVHLDNDFFNRFSTQIQDQILHPIQEHIQEDSILGVSLGSSKNSESIPLKKFSVKSFKRSGSSVTKLLAKPNEVAFNILDKVGVRFVTKSLFDTFSVMRYLVDNSILNTAHIVPDQSNNTIFPFNEFLKIIENVSEDISTEDLDKLLKDYLLKNDQSLEYFRKENLFTDSKYKFIKWIGRRLIHVGEGEERMSFFYPFEVQVIDYDNYLQSLHGPTSHAEYKKRQITRARTRVLGKH